MSWLTFKYSWDHFCSATKMDMLWYLFEILNGFVFSAFYQMRKKQIKKGLFMFVLIGVKSTSRVKLRGPQFWNQITCSCSEIHIAVRLIQSYTQQLCTLSDSCFINSGYSFTSWNSYWVHKYISKSKAANCPVRGSTPVLPWRSDTMTFMRGWMSKS